METSFGECTEQKKGWSYSNTLVFVLLASLCSLNFFFENCRLRSIRSCSKGSRVSCGILSESAAESKRIYVGTNARVEVKGVGTCKLVLRGDQTLCLVDVFLPEI